MANGYYIELESINETAESLITRSEWWLEAAGKVQTAITELTQSDTITGKTAQSITDYMEYVHGVLLGYLQVFFVAVQSTYGAYNKAYLDIDCDAHAEYDTDDLCDVIDRLAEHKKTTTDVDDYYAEAEMKGNEHLDNIGFERVKYNDVSGLLDRFDTISKTLQDVVDRVEEIESTFADTLLAEMMLDIQSVRVLIQQNLATDPRTFEPQSLASNPVYLSLVDGYENAINIVSEQMADANEAKQGRENCKAQLEREAREEEVEKYRLITSVACTTVNIICTTAFGPAGSIISGTITGALESAVNEGLDQYVATGASWGELDWGSIAIEGAFGGLKGGLTSAIGCKVTGGIKGISSSASAWTKGMQTFGWNLAGNLGKTTVSHAVDGGKAMTFALLRGKDLETALYEGAYVFGDGLIGEYSSDLVSAGFSGINAGISVRYSGPDDKAKLIGTKILSSTGEQWLDGIATRTGDALKGDGEWSDVFDGKEMRKDIAIGALTGAIDEVADSVFSKVDDVTGYSDWQKEHGGKWRKSLAGGVHEAVKSVITEEAKSVVTSGIEAEGDMDKFEKSFKEAQKDVIHSAIKSGFEEGVTINYKHDRWADDMRDRGGQQGGGGQNGDVYVDPVTGEKAIVRIDYEVDYEKIDSLKDGQFVSIDTDRKNAETADKAYSTKYGNGYKKDTAGNYTWVIHDYDPVTGEATAEYVRNDPLTNGTPRGSATTDYLNAQDALSDFKTDLSASRPSTMKGDGADFINVDADAPTVRGLPDDVDRARQITERFKANYGSGTNPPGNAGGPANPMTTTLDSGFSIPLDGDTSPLSGEAVKTMGDRLAPPLGQTVGDQLAPPFGQTLGDQLAPPFGQTVGDQLAPPFGQTVGDQLAPPFGQTVGDQLAPPFGQTVSDQLAPPFGQTVGDQLAPPFGQTVGDQLAPPFGQTVGDQLAPPFGQTVGDQLAPPFGETVGDPLAPPFGQTVGDQLAPPFGQTVGDEQGQPGWGTTVSEQILENSPLHNGAAQPVRGPLTGEDLVTMFPHGQYTDELGHLYRSEAPLEQDAPDPGLQE